ncbi:hypothetical protein QYG89_12025 [Bacillus sp. B190/17]|uniref:Uncharacterized protein n=1 Tax=Bacillus lumedeiriae TaxID=3058829 RepID=A0ABW8IA56_9BACI
MGKRSKLSSLIKAAVKYGPIVYPIVRNMLNKGKTMKKTHSKTL